MIVRLTLLAVYVGIVAALAYNVAPLLAAL